MIKKQTKYTGRLTLFARAVAGFAVFLFIYGPRILDVTNDGWIFSGYIETDVTQRYRGWLAFRNSHWVWPLTYRDLISFPFGSRASLADSVPLYLLLFRLLSHALPETFQFFGIVSAFNMCMQRVMSALLLGCFTEDKIKVLTGSVFFCLSPVMIERLFRHISLSRHWLVVAGIYLYVKSRDDKRDKKVVYRCFALLTLLTVWIHLYFTPMVAGLFAAAVFDNILNDKKEYKDILWLVFTAFFCVYNAWALGYFDMGMGNTSGYGYMGMNLNALFNPVSLGPDWWVPGKGTIKWSAFLPVRALALNNIESFNYLGLGVLSLLMAMAAWGLWLFVKQKREFLHNALRIIKRHLFLVLFCLVCFVFAVSNTVCAFSYVLFTVPLPAKLVGLFSAFRASGRLFWPVNYIILTAAVCFAANIFKNKKAGYIFIVAVLALQIWDLSPAISEKRWYTKEQLAKEPAWYCGRITEYVGDKDGLFFLEAKDDRALRASLFKEGKATNLWLISREDYGVEEMTGEIDRVKNSLLSGLLPYENMAYATYDPALAEELEGIFEVRPFEANGIYIIKVD